VAKVRVYELAKELGVESKTMMAKLNELGEFVRSASSTIEPPVVRKLRDLYPAGSTATQAKPAAKPAAARPAAPKPPAAEAAPSTPAAPAPAPAEVQAPRPAESAPEAAAPASAPTAPAAPAPKEPGASSGIGPDGLPAGPASRTGSPVCADRSVPRQRSAPGEQPVRDLPGHASRRPGCVVRWRTPSRRSAAGEQPVRPVAGHAPSRWLP